MGHVIGGHDEPCGCIDQIEIEGDQGRFVEQTGLATIWVGELVDGDSGQQLRRPVRLPIGPVHSTLRRDGGGQAGVGEASSGGCTVSTVRARSTAGPRTPASR